MVGARNYQIYWWIVKCFMLIETGAFAVGIGIVKLIFFFLERLEFSDSMLVIFGTDIEWAGVGIAFIAISLIAFVVISFVAGRYLKKEIIQLIRQE